MTDLNQLFTTSIGEVRKYGAKRQFPIQPEQVAAYRAYAAAHGCKLRKRAGQIMYRITRLPKPPESAGMQAARATLG